MGTLSLGDFAQEAAGLRLPLLSVAFGCALAFSSDGDVGIQELLHLGTGRWRQDFKEEALSPTERHVFGSLIKKAE